MGDKKNNSDRISVVVISIIGITLLCSFAYTAYKILIKRDYAVVVEIECNPKKEICFRRDCDPVIDQCKDGDKVIYKTIEKMAYNIPECNTDEQNCSRLLKCSLNETGCKIITCDPYNPGEDAECYSDIFDVKKINGNDQ